METSAQDLLIGQVIEHLKTLRSEERARELIYIHFLPQCDQYQVTEEEFYKLILKPAFREAAPVPEEDPDPANDKGTYVKVFGTVIHSLKRLGTLLFEEPVRARSYFEDVVLLKGHIDHLADADLAMEFTSLFHGEKDKEKRYLKICYRLNPKLNYRIGQYVFGSLDEMLSAGFKDRLLMNIIYKEYAKGGIHIWLHARQPAQFPEHPTDKTVVSFLTFMYNENSAYPFFIEQELFPAPAAVVARAREDAGIWGKLAAYCHNGYLFAWFNSIGQQEWTKQLQRSVSYVGCAVDLTDDEKDYTLVQHLIDTVLPDGARPLLEVNVTEIVMLDLPSTEIVRIPVNLHLRNNGFVKLQMVLQPASDGVRLDSQDTYLFKQAGPDTVTVHLLVDPGHLSKGKIYQTELEIITAYETIGIPVRLQIVFPVRPYLQYLLKYALAGGLLLGLSRWLVGSATGSQLTLAPMVIASDVDRSLPDNWLVFYWCFLGLLFSLIGSYFLIKKIEKL